MSSKFSSANKTVENRWEYELTVETGKENATSGSKFEKVGKGMCRLRPLIEPVEFSGSPRSLPVGYITGQELNPACSLALPVGSGGQPVSSS